MPDSKKWREDFLNETNRYGVDIPLYTTKVRNLLWELEKAERELEEAREEIKQLEEEITDLTYYCSKCNSPPGEHCQCATQGGDNA